MTLLLTTPSIIVPKKSGLSITFNAVTGPSRTLSNRIAYFDGVNIGPAFPDRHIIIFMVGTANGGSGPSPIAINGSAATQVINGGSNYGAGALAYAKVPSGTTANIQGTWAAQQGNFAIYYFCVTGSEALSVVFSGNLSNTSFASKTLGGNALDGGVMTAFGYGAQGAISASVGGSAYDLTHIQGSLTAITGFSFAKTGAGNASITQNSPATFYGAAFR